METLVGGQGGGQGGGRGEAGGEAGGRPGGGRGEAVGSRAREVMVRESIQLIFAIKRHDEFDNGIKYVRSHYRHTAKST